MTGNPRIEMAVTTADRLERREVRAGRLYRRGNATIPAVLQWRLLLAAYDDCFTSSFVVRPLTFISPILKFFFRPLFTDLLDFLSYVGETSWCWYYVFWLSVGRAIWYMILRPPLVIRRTMAHGPVKWRRSGWRVIFIGRFKSTRTLSNPWTIIVSCRASCRVSPSRCSFLSKLVCVLGEKDRGEKLAMNDIRVSRDFLKVIQGF